MVTWSPIKLSAMHHRHLVLGATMVEEEGWQRPAKYTTSDAELAAVREGVGLCDVSPVGKLLMEGAGIEPLIQSSAPGSLALQVGQVVRQGLLDGQGAVLDQVLLCRLAHDQLFLLTSPEKTQAVVASLGQHLDGCLHLVDMTSVYAGMVVAGPWGGETLAKVTELNLSLSALPDLSCVQGSVAQVHALAVRADRGDLACYEVYVSRDLGEFVWDAIVDAGQEFGIAPFGVEALRRLQKGE